MHGHNNAKKQILGLSYVLLLLSMNEENKYAADTTPEPQDTHKPHKNHFKRQEDAGIKFMHHKTPPRERNHEKPIREANSYCLRKR